MVMVQAKRTVQHKGLVLSLNSYLGIMEVLVVFQEVLIVLLGMGVSYLETS